MPITYHFGESSGLVGFEEMSAVPLPSYWRNLRIETGQSQLDFLPANIKSIQALLPSLWEIKADRGSEVLENNKENDGFLLEFRQAYDKQWQLYKTDNLLKAFLGFRKVNSEHVKVNGWSNGWIISEMEMDQQTTFYALYSPERLAWVGWGVAVATSLTLFGYTWRKNRARKFVQLFGVKDRLRGKR